MSKDTDPNESKTVDGTATAKAVDPQLEAAKNSGNTWEFEGREYSKLIVNRTGNIGMPVFDPSDKSKQIGILIADFLWENDEPYLDLVDYDIRDEALGRETQKSVSKMADIPTLNCQFFQSTVQRGFWIDVNEDGEQSEPQPLTREQLLNDFAPEVHSRLVTLFTDRFFVERYYPAGPPKGMELLKEPTELFFKCSVGSPDNPAHVMIIECDVPSPQARKEFRDNLAVRENEQRGDTKITRLYINDSVKLKFVRKRIISVKGAVLAPSGQVEVDDKDLLDIAVSDAVSLKRFANDMNPEWLMKLCNELLGAFNFAEK